MACDTTPRKGQTLTQRKEEVREVLARVARGLVTGKITAKVGPQGAIAFAGLLENERAGVTDACVYRLLMVTGSAQAKLALMKAEQLAGRSVSRQALAHGHHSHDGGHTWHHGH